MFKNLIFILFLFPGTPLWLFLQISPVKNERDVVVLFLCTFRDITALKQPIEEDSKGSFPKVCRPFIACWPLEMANSLLLDPLFSGGLSKFAKLARSVTRSRSALASQLSNQVTKDVSKQSNLTQVTTKASEQMAGVTFVWFLIRADPDLLIPLSFSSCLDPFFTFSIHSLMLTL